MDRFTFKFWIFSASGEGRGATFALVVALLCLALMGAVIGRSPQAASRLTMTGEAPRRLALEAALREGPKPGVSRAGRAR